jgi:hypothetical protein
VSGGARAMNEGSRSLLNRRLFLLERKREILSGEIALKKCRERRKRLLFIVYVKYIYRSILDFKELGRGKRF